MTPSLRLGTRRSELALHQARLARELVMRAEPELQVELVEIESDGDLDPRELAQIDERGIFAHALERALRDGRIDAAVHSSKDVELRAANDLQLAAWLPRADARDALVGDGDLQRLARHGERVATGSARRTAILHTIAPGVQPAPVRGNVRTRLQRSAERGDGACMLAMAGLVRLGITTERNDVYPLPVDVCVPDSGQGAVVVQAPGPVCPRTGFAWARIDDAATRRAAMLERELALLLGGGCEHPMGVHVELQSGRIHAFAAPSREDAGRTITLDLLGLELATLLSTSTPIDIDDAAAHAARALAPDLRAQLHLEPVA